MPLHLDRSDPEPPEHVWKGYHFQRILNQANSGAISGLVKYTCKIGEDSAG